MKAVSARLAEARRRRERHRAGAQANRARGLVMARVLAWFATGSISCYASHADLADSLARDTANDEDAGAREDRGAEAADDVGRPSCGNGIVEPGEECDRDPPQECVTACDSAGRRSCVDCSWGACEPPADTCNGRDDDCNGVTDDVDGTVGCGNGCCNVGEDSCICPGDCGPPAAPTIPTPLRPINGERVASPRPVFRWLPSVAACGPATYDLQVDDSCSSPGFASCSFPSPEFSASGTDATGVSPETPLPVSGVPPVGRRYYWRVRACDGGAPGACSAWSSVRYVDVGMAELDFNGDGFSDLAIGAPTWSSGDLPGGWETGAVYLYYGSPAGIRESTWTKLTNPEVPDTQGWFGFRVAGSDLNGDGFSDLVVSALNSSSFGSGDDVYVYFGRPEGIRPVADASFHEPDLRRAFGVSIAGLGDLDADGFGELGIGASGTSRTSDGGNQVFVYAGGPGGLIAAPTVVDHPPPRAASAFGLAIGPGDDFDGDGYGEMTVGAPFFDGSFEDEGRVVAYAGAAGGVETTPFVVVEDPEPAAAHGFGFSLARGDIDGDGFADVAVGATGVPGEVFLYGGGLGGLETTPWSRLGPPVTVPPADDVGFGRRLAMCDVNGDGRADLAVAAPQQRREAASAMPEGAIFVWYGSDTGFAVAPTVIVWGPSPDELAAFGDGLACVGDVDGDGFDDLAVGAPREARHGRVRLYHGSAAGLTETPRLVLDLPHPPAGVPGAQFGAAIASM